MNVLGIDPGRRKTGVAALNAQGEILWREIIAPNTLEARLPELLNQWQIERIALGDSTASENARAQIERAIVESDYRTAYCGRNWLDIGSARALLGCESARRLAQVGAPFVARAAGTD